MSSRDYLEVIERVLDQRAVDFDAQDVHALYHFLESELGRDIALVWLGWPLLTCARARCTC